MMFIQKSKIKRIIIYTAVIIIGTSSFSYTLNKSKDKRYDRYVTKTADSIINDDYNIVAHRGFSSLEVENTGESLSLASSKDYVDMIEFDVRLTKDKKIILSHNNVLNVSAVELINISLHNYDELINK